jgi:hypothetical protein
MLRPHPDDHVEKPKTDWTDLFQHGVNLRRWWTDRLGGNETPPLFSWEELARERWGPAAADPTPGIIIDRPDQTRMRAALRSADPSDPYTLVQGEAVPAEGEEFRCAPLPPSRNDPRRSWTVSRPSPCCSDPPVLDPPRLDWPVL